MAQVSIIMPAYNVAPYLAAAIESVCCQTFRDIELLVIDDGSTDQTREIAMAWASRDARVRVLYQPNGGISSARNHGLRVSSAPFIALLDSDDIWAPDYLQAQLDILHAHPEVDVVTGNAYFLGSRLDGQLARPFPDTRPAPDLVTLIADEQSVFIMSVFRRRVYETIGGFDEALRTNEDYDYWLRAATAGFRFYRNDRPLGHYRRRDDSLSASELRMLRGILHVYRKVRPQLRGQPVPLAILDSQVARFEKERIAAEAREAIETGNHEAAGKYLEALYAQRGGATLGVARLLARWAPGLLTRAYQIRRARQEAGA